jgi:hypothetical protein
VVVDYAIKILLADNGIAIPQISIPMGLIIFDCDGVLVDSEPIAHGLLAQMMTDLGHPMSTPSRSKSSLDAVWRTLCRSSKTFWGEVFPIK